MADKDKKKPAIRHAEKRRTSTCRFADRVAQLSVDHYKTTIPLEKRPPQTCIATILAHFHNDKDVAENASANSGNRGSDNNKKGGMLWVVSMGVGTKFLSESCLQHEVDNEKEHGYGSRVRDMHAEILARRAFRRQLSLEIQRDLQVQAETGSGGNMSILVRSKDTSPERRDDGGSKIRYMLRPGVTLHMYTSSAPCGNATLKKFCKMAKERFRDDLGPDEWPNTPHEPPPGHSVKLGEFSLLLKKDNTHRSKQIINNDMPGNDDDYRKVCNENRSMHSNIEAESKSSTSMDHMNPSNKKRTRVEEDTLLKGQSDASKIQRQKSATRRGKPWPANLSDNWAPPGTTIVGFKHMGSIHTCSDKICRWNYLGLQGSLLASILEEPLYLSTLTVGRKLSGSVCRRAICCRLDTRCRQPSLQPSSEKTVSMCRRDGKSIEENRYRVNHPTVMGTSVYLDTSVVDTSNIDERGQDVRFHSSFVWSWWAGPPECENGNQLFTSIYNEGVLECIESSSGLLARENEYNHDTDSGQSCNVAPKVSTKELTLLFLKIFHLATAGGDVVNNSVDISCLDRMGENSDDEVGLPKNALDLLFDKTLMGIRKIKERCSPMHESFKDLLLTEHKVLSNWRRRSDRNKCTTCV